MAPTNELLALGVKVTAVPFVVVRRSRTANTWLTLAPWSTDTLLAAQAWEWNLATTRAAGESGKREGGRERWRAAGGRVAELSADWIVNYAGKFCVELASEDGVPGQIPASRSGAFAPVMIETGVFALFAERGVRYQPQDSIVAAMHLTEETAIHFISFSRLMYHVRRPCL